MRAIITTVIVAAFFLPGCSDEGNGKATDDHVWKEQTATIDMAKGVQDILNKSAEDKAKLIEEQMQQ